MLNELLEFLGVSDLLLLFAVTLSFDESTACVVESFSFHGVVWVFSVFRVQDHGLDSNCLGGIDVITSDHADSDSSFLDSGNSSGYFSSDGILNADNADENVFLLQLNVLNTGRVFILAVGLLLFLHFFIIVPITALTLLHILVGDGDGPEGVHGVSCDLTCDLFSVGVGNRDDVAFFIQTLVALLKDDFGSSLQLSSDTVAILTVALGEGSHSLSAGGEVEGVEAVSLGLVLGSHLLDDFVFVSIVATLDQVDHGLIGGRGSLERHVAADSFSEFFNKFLVKTHFTEILFSRDLQWLLGDRVYHEGDAVGFLLDSDSRFNRQIFAREHFDNFHDIVSESAGFVRADVVSASHDFAGSELLHITLVFQHLDDRVGESNHDSQGKTLRDSHDDNHDTDSEVGEPLANVLDEAAVVITAAVGLALLSAEKVDLSSEQTFPDEANHESVESEESKDSSELTNVKGDFIELVVEGSLVIFLLKLGLDETKGGVVTDNNGDHLSFSRGDRASGLDDRGRKRVLADSSSLSSLVLGFVTSRCQELGLAVGGDVFMALIRFSSHGGLVATEGSFNAESVNGDLVSDLERNEVSDEDFIGMNVVVSHTVSD